MSFSERPDNMVEEEFDDIWFDSSEESWFDTLEYHVEEIYEIKELKDYVEGVEKNKVANLPSLEFYQRLLNYFYQGDVLFKRESLYFEKFQQLLNDIECLQLNHQNGIRKQDHKFKVILSRLEEAVNRIYEPENIPTDALLKRERVFYAQKLTECTKNKTNLEESFMKDFRRLESEALTLSDELTQQTNMMSNFQQGFAERLGSEERLRWVYYGQQQLKIANLEGQEFVAKQFAKIQQLEIENEQLRRTTNGGPFIYHQAFLNPEDRVIPEEDMAINGLEEDLDYDGIAEPQLDVMKNEELHTINYDGQLANHNSYHEDRIDVENGANGRFYPLWSRNQMTREFAMAKYDRDLEKRRKDRADMMVDPQGESQDPIKNWIMKLADKYANVDSINIPETSTVADLGSAGKRTFDDFYNDGEKAEEQQDRKRVRVVSMIPRIASYQPIPARFQREDGNASQYSWQDPGHYGYDGKYYAPEGKIECERDQVPSVATGAIGSNLQYHTDSKNTGPPLRLQTPVQLRVSPAVLQDPSHYVNGNNSGQPLHRNASISRRSPPHTGRRVSYSPSILSSPNRSRAVTSSIRRISASMASPRAYLNKTPNTI
ncbi:hypothetical protein EYC80_010317 [Monilinia laxa]|uniref:Uncharacterized protein n=1 Tax=Monilinia laxa TaxID=61186 RepID=A0A5N6JPV7_MONLA|nr:hypothetical protein EYC80_010317 [Monilinia laxa]